MVGRDVTHRSAWALVFFLCGCARTVPTSPPPAPPGPPPLKIPPGCEGKLTGEWQLQDDSTFRYHFEDDGAAATVWVYRAFPPPDAGLGSRLFPRPARDGGGLVAARDAGTLKDGGVDLVAAGFILADALFTRERYEEAAKGYLEVVAQEPKRDFAPSALDSAGQAFEKTRHFADAVEAYGRLIKEYPKSKLAEGAVVKLALNAEATGDFARAIETYQKLIKDYPLSKDRPVAQANLGALLAGTGKDAEAIAAFARFVELYPKNDDAPKLQLKIAALYDAKKDYPKELTALNGLLQKFGGPKGPLEPLVEARRLIAELWLKQDKEPELKKALAATADEYDRRVPNPDGGGGACEAAAAARWTLADFETKQLEKLKPTGVAKALDKSIAARNTATKSATAAWDKVVRYQRPKWSAAALYRKGELLERFGQLLAELPASAEPASPDALLAMRVDLEDRAVLSYRACLGLARAGDFKNDWTMKADAALTRLRPPEATPDGGLADAGPPPRVSETSSAETSSADAGAADAGNPRPDAGFDGGEEAEHHHPLPPDLVPRDGGTAPLAAAVIHLRRTPDGFIGEAETLHLLPSGRECRATFPTRIAACGSSTLTLVSAASTPVGDGCQTPALPRPAALLEHHLARTDAGEL